MTNTQRNAREGSGRSAPRFLIALALLLASPDPALAESPELHRVIPQGAQRGTTATVQLQGVRLGDTMEALLFTPGFAVEEIKPLNDNAVEMRLSVAADCALGEHSLRLRTSSGLSELRTFWVSQFPIVQETEPNSLFDQAQGISMNVTASGVITNEDVDFFKVSAKQGERISAEVEGMRCGVALFDPYVAILDSRRFELSASDDSALLLQDGIASIVAPEDGDYVIQVRESAYGGNDACSYRVHVGGFPRPRVVYPPGGKGGTELKVTFLGDAAGPFEGTIKLPEIKVDPENPFAPYISFGHRILPEQAPWFSPSPVVVRASAFDDVSEQEPNNARDQATLCALGVPFGLNGIVDRAGDVDYFRFHAAKGQAFNVRAHAKSLRSSLDSVLWLENAGGGVLAYNDDSGGLDGAFDFTAPEDGDYFIGVRDHLNKGGPASVYRVELRVIGPSLNVNLQRFGRDSQARQVIAVPRGNRYAAVVRANRASFAGKVILEPVGLPAGMTATLPEIAGSVNECVALFEAAADAPLSGALAGLQARCDEVQPKVTGSYRYSVELVVGEPNQTVYYRRGLDKLAVAVTREAPFRLEVEAAPVPLVQNGSMNLKVSAQRSEGFVAPILLRMLWNPPGVGSSPTVTINGDQSEALYPVNAAGNAECRSWQIAILGEADTPSGRVLVSTGLTTLTVAPPFLELKIEMAAIEQGKPGSVLCTLTHHQAFEGKARAVLYGLPHLVTTQVCELTKDDTQLVFPIQSDPTSPAGKHQQLFCQLFVPQNGTEILHNLGHYGVLRIDPPPPPETLAAAPPPPPTPAPAAPDQPAPKPLTRLEQLRQQAQQGGGQK